MPVTFAVESGRAVRPEIDELTRLHWEEIALDKGKIELAPDYAKYEELEARGALHVVTARDAGKLVGYHIAFIHPHLHYCNDLMCFTDIFFIHPDYRDGYVGLALFHFIETEMKKLGVKKLFAGCKDHHNLATLFTRLGWTPSDHIYAKYIG